MYYGITPKKIDSLRRDLVEQFRLDTLGQLLQFLTAGGRRVELLLYLGQVAVGERRRHVHERLNKKKVGIWARVITKEEYWSK